MTPRSTTTDARGRTVPLAFAPATQLSAEMGAAMGRERFLRVCHRLNVRVEVSNHAALMGSGVVLGIAGLALGFLAFRLTPMWFYAGAALVASFFMIASGLRFRPRTPPVDAALLAHAIAAEGLCPSCAYSLENIIPESDGLTLCPECGSAWRRGPHPPTSPNSA